jgi:hypothetical protein
MSYQSNDIIDGASYGEWTGKWWQWFIDPPRYDTVVDKGLTIPLYTLKQLDLPEQHVIFIGGRMVTQEKEIHKIYREVEQDKAILLPVDNWISIGHRYLTRDSVLERVAKERMAMIVELRLKIDDDIIKAERVMSPAFPLNVPSTSPYLNMKTEIGQIKKGKYKAISDGYWLFLKPNSLEKGTHVIETFGSCQTGRLSLEIHHTIDII